MASRTDDIDFVFFRPKICCPNFNFPDHCGSGRALAALRLEAFDETAFSARGTAFHKAA